MTSRRERWHDGAGKMAAYVEHGQYRASDITYAFRPLA